MEMAEERVETTFWSDFSIADAFGERAVQDTYDRAFAEWKSDHMYLTELSMTLNHKIWQHWESGNSSMAELYDKLWREADAYAYSTLKGEELAFYFNVTD